MVTPSARAAIVEARTYLRPIDEANGIFETPEQAADRIVGHQRWLWQRAKAGMTKSAGDWLLYPLTDKEEAELQELKTLFLDRKVTFSGRTRWLGGTSIGREIESTQFNCAFTEVRSIHDVVDVLWLLLQGCGVGFKPVVGSLNGFTKPVEIEVIRSQRNKDQKGRETNVETFNRDTGEWRISVGDSAVGWAKSAGKLMAGKFPAKKLILEFTEIRGPGGRLKNYGWISSGDEQISKAFKRIAEIMSARAGQLLTREDILDIVNLLGTILSSRRSAEIMLFEYGAPEWETLARAKKDYWANLATDHRGASNNSILFYAKPTKYQLKRIFKIMEECGGSEPGFINAVEAMRRAPWFKGVNPCVPGETPILTRGGYAPIKERVGKPTEVWNGHEWSLVSPYSTGVNPLVRVELSDGTTLDCTPYHNWVIKPSYRDAETRVIAKDLKPGMMLAKFDMPVVTMGIDFEGDAYSQGFYSGDGNTDLKHSWIYEPKFSVIPRLSGVVSEVVTYGRVTWKHGPMRAKNWVPHNASLDYRLNWLAGLFDADGTVVRDVNGNGLQLSTCDADFLREVRLLLTTVGVQAKLNLMNPAGKLFDGYECQECWRLLVNSTDVCRLVNEVGIQFSRLEVHGEAPQRDARRFVTVSSVTPLEGEVETFCFTEPKNHTGTFNGIVTGQCAEILLADRGFCVAADTPLITRNGCAQISELDGTPVEVWNGEEWSEVTPFQTSVASKLLRVHFGDGTYLDCTEYHKFSIRNRFESAYRKVEARDLQNEEWPVHTQPFQMTNTNTNVVEDAYTMGVAYGDGYGNEITLYGDAKIALPVTGTRTRPHDSGNPAVQRVRVKTGFNIDDFNIDTLFTWNRTSVLNFVAGLADTDGSVTESGGIRIYQGDENFIRRLYLVLLHNGVKSSVCKMADEGQRTNFGPRKKAMWYLSITDAREIPCHRLDTTRGHTATKKGKEQTIRAVVELDGLHPTYCFTEPKKGMGVFNGTLTYQCNLVETVLPRFNGDDEGLHRAHWLIARANYRQTCVVLEDPILQRGWHENQEFLRLCGAGVTGNVGWEHVDEDVAWQDLRKVAHDGANSMADELDMPRAKAITTVKPSGTQSKALGTIEFGEVCEGLHKPLAKYIFNRIRFSVHDPIVAKLRAANYAVEPDPSDPTGALVVMPVAFHNVEFDVVDGMEVNLESAVSQLERYKRLMRNYVDHNASITVSYDSTEVPDIVDWLVANWDDYVGVSFLYRTDPTKTAADLGYHYLPQQPVTKETYDAYVAQLKPFDLRDNASTEMIEQSDCAGGACPIR